MSTSTIHPTPTAAPHSSTPTQLAVPTESIEFRSQAVARIAARMHEIPDPTVTFLSNPATIRSKTYNADPLCDLILALIKSSEANETTSNPLTKQREISIGIGLADALRWLHQFRMTFDDALVDRLLLKCLIPMYLAAGNGRVGTSVSESMILMRSSCALLELDRITSNHDLAEWLRNTNPKLDPIVSVPGAFRVCLDLMSKSFWTELNKGNSASAIKTIEAKTFANKHSAWWSLTCQLSDQKTHITVPAEVSVGAIAWDKIMEHWDQVIDALNGTTKTISRNKPQRSLESCSNAMNTAQPSDQRSGSNPPSSQVTAQPNQQFDFANDNRFVEIRSSKDPHLSSILDQLLMQCRNDQGLLSLIVVKKLEPAQGATNHLLQNWQAKFIESMDQRGESSNVRGFISDDGELSLVFQDVERSELAQWVRDSFARLSQTGDDSQLATPTAQPLVSGVATVNAPSRSFKIEQLIQAAWRCLDGAINQGAGAVKTIEVY